MYTGEADSDADASTAVVANCGFTKPMVSMLRATADGGEMYSITGEGVTQSVTGAGVVQVTEGACVAYPITGAGAV